MENLEIYSKVKQVPENAQKPIFGGRLKGMTDVNPMWRIKTLTDVFGPCGIGWKYEITDKRLEQGAEGTVAAFVDINLYIKIDGQWSDAIPGTGGSMFVSNEKSGLYVSDECFKMALTDAISVSCKSLGMAADVYWDKDRTKYDNCPGEENGSPIKSPPPLVCADCGRKIQDAVKKNGEPWPKEQIAAYSEQRYGRKLCTGCGKAAKNAVKEEAAREVNSSGE